MCTLGRPSTHLLLLSLSLVAAACASSPSRRSSDESRRYARMEELLAHRAPELDFRSRGGRLVLAIRGRPALSGIGEPLVVIDGVPIYRGGAEMLVQLSPSDVLRVEVLRDVASASAYGRRGADGVVVVTTRRAP